MRRHFLMLAVCAMACSWSGGASAQFSGDTLRIFALGELGVGGSMSFDAGGSVDMSPSFGVAAGADYGLHDLFAIGLMGRWLSINPQDDLGLVGSFTSDRSTVVDLAVYPRVRLPLPIVEVYAMVPFGISFLTPPVGDGQTGYNLGLYGGAQVGLLPLLSLVAQLGYSRHAYSDMSFNELTINAGLAIGI